MSKRFVLTLGLLITVLVGTSAIGQGASALVPTWEYRVVTPEDFYKNPSEVLNTLGVDGWLLVRRSLPDGTLVLIRQAGEVVNAWEYLAIERNDWIRTVTDQAIDGNVLEGEQKYLNELGSDGWTLSHDVGGLLIFVRQVGNTSPREFQVINNREWIERENLTHISPLVMQDLLNSWGVNGWELVKVLLPITPHPAVVLTKEADSETQIEYRLIDRSDWMPPTVQRSSLVIGSPAAGRGTTETDDPFLQALQDEEDRLNELEEEGWRLVEYSLPAANALVFQKVEDEDVRYEYIIVPGPEWEEMVEAIEGDRLQTYTELLNKFGSQGWEIDNMTPFRVRGSLVFKRIVTP